MADTPHERRIPLKTLAELQRECTALGIYVAMHGRASKETYHAPNNVAKSSLIPDSVISRTRLRPKYGQGWQPRLDPHPRQADGRGLGEEEST